MGLPKAKAPVSRVVSREKVVAAFHAFVEGRQEKINEAQGKLVADALEELLALRTAAFDEWFVRNHYRYRQMREIDRRHARGLARAFLGQMMLGKVEIDA